MDGELLIALCVLWLSSTFALVMCLMMWFFNEGEGFHPHSVEIDHRHSMFVVVHSNTCCKLDCCVKSISEFIAPRGSSSSKLFTILGAMISVSGFLGCFRWFKVGDGKLLEVILSLSGFASLLLVAMFELNVAPEKYLQDKILVTGWLLQKLNLDKSLPFNVNDIHDSEFRNFIRQSKGIYHLYEEDVYIAARSPDFKKWEKSDEFWLSMHMVGATSYVVLITAAILLNDLNEHPVAWITGVCFFLFSTLGYLTGHYVPVFRILRCWLLLWNPFLREPNFMLRLKQAVAEYQKQRALSQNIILSTTVPESAQLVKETNIRSPSARIRQKSKGSEMLINDDNWGTVESHPKRRISKTKSPSRMAVPPNSRTKVSALTTKVVGTASKKESVEITTTTIANNIEDVSTSLHMAYLNNSKPLGESEIAEAQLADLSLDNFSLRFARSHPITYLKVVGHLMVMSELVALLTPAVAMGIQWVTALCDGPPVPALLQLFSLGFRCLIYGECQQSLEESWKHCIVKEL